MNQYFVSFFKTLLIAILIFPVIGLAQDTKPSEASIKAQLEKNVRSFCQAYSKLPTSKDKSTVLKYFSTKSTANIFYFGVSDKIRTMNSTYDGFDKFLERVSKTNGMKIRYEVVDILRNYVNQEVATTAFTVDYEIEEDQGFHVKGSETVTFAWKKIGSDWKVVHYTVMGTEDAKLRGTCLCEVYGGTGGKYAVRTTVPSGRSYSTEFSEFEVRKTGDETVIKTADNTFFKMSEKGEIYKLTDSQEAGEKLGEASEAKGAILLIVKRHLYPDNCTNVKYVK